MAIDISLFESWVKFAVIAHWVAKGKPEGKPLAEEKEVTFSCKTDSSNRDSLWTETIKPTIDDKDIEHFEKTYTTYEGHYD